MFNKKYIKALHNQIKSQDKMIENYEKMIDLGNELNIINDNITSNLESQIETCKGYIKFLKKENAESIKKGMDFWCKYKEMEKRVGELEGHLQNHIDIREGTK